MSLELRQHIEKIVPLTDDEFAFVRSHFASKKFLKHQFLIQEGNHVEHDFFVVNGLLKSFHMDEDGKEHILQFAMKESWITDPQAYHHQTKATLNVSCLQDSEVLSITLRDKEKLCAALQKMEHFFRKTATAGSILLQRRVLCLISNNANDRYNDLIENYPDLIQLVPKAMIASYLGVSRETLSRLLIQ
jgi:CRP-like cAMP-binding protein